MNKPASVLIIDGEEEARHIIGKGIRGKFPEIHLDTATSPEQALEQIQKKEYAVIVCSAHLFHDDKISFLTKLCQTKSPRPTVIAVTTDTDINTKSFPHPIQGGCVRHVMYKPLDLHALFAVLEQTLRSRTKEG